MLLLLVFWGIATLCLVYNIIEGEIKDNEKH